MVRAATASLSNFSNALISSKQLINARATQSEHDTSITFASCLLTQAAGILLRLPQDVIATAIVLLQRHLAGQPSPTDSQHKSPRHLSAASIYLSAKNSFTPLGTRSVVNVYAYLLSKQASPFDFVSLLDRTSEQPDPHSYYVSEGDYERERLKILHYESLLLAGIGFDVHVALPFTLALTYMSALGVQSRQELAVRVFKHLNDALLSPQLLYLTHQPNVLATAAIYLAAKEVGVKLVESVNWWEVFDVDREGLGFCVMAMGSLSGFAEAEQEKWKWWKLLLV